MKIIDFIICDDIRREIGNKISVVGIFSDAILFPNTAEWPIATNLSLFARALIEPGEPQPDAYAITISCNDTLLGENKGSTQKTSNSILNIMMHMRPIPIPEPGIMKFRIELFRDGAPVMEPAEYVLSAKSLDADEMAKLLSGV